MKIDHVAIWCRDIEKLKDFYVRYFEALPGERYVNPKKNFQSYFLSFKTDCRMELMQMSGILDSKNDSTTQSIGIIHIAISVGSKEKVDTLTARLRADGIEVVGEPRTTGDGYYESVITDPEGNRIEITV
jgi:lactoylglutathione lyase